MVELRNSKHCVVSIFRIYRCKKMTQAPIPPKHTQTDSLKRLSGQSNDESTARNEIININDETSTDSWVNACYGDYVELVDGRLGLVRYIGTPNRKSSNIWYGISLDKQSGQHNGTQNGITYWQDEPNHGIFVKSKEIVTIIKRYVSTTSCLCLCFVVFI